jgi:hypothetical protein
MDIKLDEAFEIGEKGEDEEVDEIAIPVIPEGEFDRLVRKDQILDELMQYIEGADAEHLRRLESFKTKEERRQLIEEAKRKEIEVFRGNASGVYNLLGGKFYVHRRLHPMRKQQKDFSDFVFTKHSCSAPGEIAVMMKGNELVMKPWNSDQNELRFMAPEIVQSAYHGGNLKAYEGSAGTPASRAILGRYGSDRSKPFMVKVGNRFVDSRTYGGRRRPPQNNNVTTRIPKSSKLFPGNRVSSDYPLEVSYNGTNRIPIYTPLDVNPETGTLSDKKRRKQGTKSTKRR